MPSFLASGPTASVFDGIFPTQVFEICIFSFCGLCVEKMLTLINRQLDGTFCEMAKTTK